MVKINRGKVITITSMKGGVGKTISALLFAAILKKQKKKVLIIDLDLYNGDIAFGLNLNVKESIYNLCDDIANNRYKNDSQNYIVNYDEYIDVLAAPKDPRQAPKIDRKYVEMIIRKFINKYDVILIDTNHILTVNNMIAFECSDAIVNIFSNDAFDLKATKNFVSICENIGVDNLYLVLNTTINKKQYFSIQDIDTILKRSIDFVISDNFYIKNIDREIVDGNIFDAISKVIKSRAEDTSDFTKFLQKLLEDKVGGSDNEEK